MQHYKICDLGGSVHFWDKLGIDIDRRNITIYNIDKSDAAGISKNADESILYKIYDGSNIPVEDNHFDLLICNSVIEHVPLSERAAFAKEMLRVSKNIFCQTPAANSPLEYHFIMPFIHWLPKKWGYYLVHISPWRIISRPDPTVIKNYFWGTNLLQEDELRMLFPQGIMHYEKLMGIIKSFYIIVKK